VDARAARALARHAPPRVTPVPAQPYLRFDRNDYSLDPLLVGRRAEVRATEAEITAVCLDTGEPACRHTRVLADRLALTDPPTSGRSTS
jgi:hypothetical protein